MREVKITGKTYADVMEHIGRMYRQLLLSCEDYLAQQRLSVKDVRDSFHDSILVVSQDKECIGMSDSDLTVHVLWRFRMIVFREQREAAAEAGIINAYANDKKTTRQPKTQEDL